VGRPASAVADAAVKMCPWFLARKFEIFLHNFVDYKNGDFSSSVSSCCAATQNFLHWSQMCRNLSLRVVFGGFSLLKSKSVEPTGTSKISGQVHGCEQFQCIERQAGLSLVGGRIVIVVCPRQSTPVAVEEDGGDQCSGSTADADEVCPVESYSLAARLRGDLSFLHRVAAEQRQTRHAHQRYNTTVDANHSASQPVVIKTLGL